MRRICPLLMTGLLVAGAAVAYAQNAPLDAERLLATYRCGACHTGIPAPATSLAPALGAEGAKYDRAYVYRYLASPGRTSIPGRARMPDYRLSDSERLALALYLGGSRGVSATRADRREFQQAQRQHKGVDADDGRAIFRALSCAACHPNADSKSWVNGPDLTHEGQRVQLAWLRAYLRRPVPVRPFGFQPGSGGRMPDYKLSGAEADTLAAFFFRARNSQPAVTAQRLSAFAMAKTETLLREKLACLGCHQLGSEGGRIGPSFDNIAARLQPGFVRAIISDPARTAPGTVMPKLPLDSAMVRTLTSYLLQRGAQPARNAYLSLTDNPMQLPTSSSEPRATYARYCALCHGPKGGGDGFNAKHMGAQPTAHASAEKMSKRPDDTLYDAIHAGAYILGRSPRMPAFGETLTRAQIRGLVSHIRELCKCEGPAWSRDGARTP